MDQTWKEVCYALDYQVLERYDTERSKRKAQRRRRAIAVESERGGAKEAVDMPFSLDVMYLCQK